MSLLSTADFPEKFPLDEDVPGAGCSISLNATAMKGNSPKVLPVISWGDNTYSVTPLCQSDAVVVFRFSHMSIPLEAVQHHLWGEPSCEINC